jgi:hypothetical protein
VVNALSVVLLRSGVDAANETIYEQLSAELSGDFDFDLERMKADIDAALPELRDEVRLNAFKVECSNGESVDGERLRNVARLVVADDGLQKSLLDDLVTKLVSRLEGIGLEVCEKDDGFEVCVSRSSPGTRSIYIWFCPSSGVSWSKNRFFFLVCW